MMHKNRANAPSKVAQNHWTRAYEASKAKKLMSLSKNLERRNEKKLEEKQSLLQDLEREQTLKISGSTHHDKMPIALKDVTLYRDGEAVLSGINLTLCQGQKLSLQGANGCGKSTLIKYLTGDESLINEGGSVITAEGGIHIAKGLKISYVGQDTSVLKGTIYGIAEERGCDKTKFSTILVKMGFTKEMLYRDVDALSLGQKKFIMLALSLCEQADVYLWDEPLNYIDVYMRKEIERLIKNSDVTMLFVEHDVAFVESVADDRVELA